MIYSRGLHQPDSSDLYIINRYIRFRLRARSRSTRASCCPDSARTHAYTHARASRQRADLRRTARQRTSEGLPAHVESVQYDGCHAGRERQVLQRVVLHGASDISQPVESRPRHAACPPDGKMRSGRTTVMRIVRPTRRLSRASPRSSGRRGRRRKEWKITAHEERVCRCCRSEVIFCMSPIWSIRRTHRPSKMLPELP